MLLGAHVPTSGGVAMAPGNGRSIEATAIQIFTRSQRQWKAKPMSGQESGAFRSALGGSGVKAVLAHASYLINLSSVVPQFLALSRKTLAEELRRCHALGIPHAVVHPGAHMGAGDEQGLAAVARFLDDARLARVPMVVETPGPIEVWKKEIALLRGLVGRRPRG